MSLSESHRLPSAGPSTEHGPLRHSFLRKEQTMLCGSLQSRSHQAGSQRKQTLHRAQHKGLDNAEAPQEAHRVCTRQA